jgi:hypothetical protein
VATDTPLNINDDYTENTTTGVDINISQIGSTVTVSYTTSDTGVPGIIHYSITHLA